MSHPPLGLSCGQGGHLYLHDSFLLLEVSQDNLCRAWLLLRQVTDGAALALYVAFRVEAMRSWVML